MEWLKSSEFLPNPKSHAMYWVTDGECVCWCFYGCDDAHAKHYNWIGGDLTLRDDEITHWCKIVLPNGKNESSRKKITRNREWKD